MKRQAFLITAYKDAEALYNLISALDDADEVYIHIDKKNKEKMYDSPFMSEIEKREGCHIYSEFSVPWGGYDHVRAMLFLMSKALKKGDDVYIHMLTGEDLPIIPAKEIRKRFTETEDSTKIFLDWFEEKEFNSAVKKRYEVYNLFQGRNLRNPLIWHIKCTVNNIQRLCGIHRKTFGEFDVLYKGLFYISLPGECAADILDYVREHKEYEKAMYLCELPEEFFFHTLLLNESFAGGKWKDKIVRQELRYMRWDEGDGSSPAYLSEKDIPLIKEAAKEGKVFARKFHGADRI